MNNARKEVHGRDFFPLVSQMVLATDAIGFVAKSYSDSKRFKKSFATVPYLETLPPAPLCCAVRRRWPPKPPARAFISACREFMPLQK
jgi:hypothetical protein